MAINDAQDNAVPQSQPSIVQPDYVTDTPAFSVQTTSRRVAQQQVLPTAIQDRFLNPVTQWSGSSSPFAQEFSGVGSVAIHLTDGSSDNNNSGIIGFQFTGTTDSYVDVDVGTAIFIDQVDYLHAYPFGGAVGGLGSWAVEQLHDCFFPPTFADGSNAFYAPAKPNQSGDWLIVKNYTGSAHDIIVYYNWRAIMNQGGKRST